MHAESIHAQFNSLLRTYSGIKDPVAKLKSILQDHYISISPHMTSAVPPPNICEHLIPKHILNQLNLNLRAYSKL